VELFIIVLRRQIRPYLWTVYVAIEHSSRPIFEFDSIRLLSVAATQQLNNKMWKKSNHTLIYSKLEIDNLWSHRNDKQKIYTYWHNACTSNDDLNFLTRVNGGKYNEYSLVF